MFQEISGSGEKVVTFVKNGFWEYYTILDLGINENIVNGPYETHWLI